VQLTIGDDDGTAKLMDMLLAKKRAGDRKAVAGRERRSGDPGGLTHKYAMPSIIASLFLALAACVTSRPCSAHSIPTSTATALPH
jgi:hypothetical protein